MSACRAPSPREACVEEEGPSSSPSSVEVVPLAAGRGPAGGQRPHAGGGNDAAVEEAEDGAEEAHRPQGAQLPRAAPRFAAALRHPSRGVRSPRGCHFLDRRFGLLWFSFGSGRVTSWRVVGRHAQVRWKGHFQGAAGRRGGVHNAWHPGGIWSVPAPQPWPPPPHRRPGGAAARLERRPPGGGRRLALRPGHGRGAALAAQGAARRG